MNEISLNVGGIAHDLNNQIMILMNALDRMMVLCPHEPDALRAMKAAEHCASLTRQLVPRKPEPCLPSGCSVREIVGEAAMLIRPLLPARNRLEVDCRTDCCIAAIPAAIQQALVNLCLNAIDAMDGPGVIRIEAEQVAASAIISVSDTGPGVPAHLTERIFEPRFTTKSAAQGEPGGSGLGLSRVRQTVAGAGGAISVDDVFPHGARFRIILPALNSHDTLKFENSSD